MGARPVAAPLLGPWRRWDPAPPPARSGDELVVRFCCPECESAEHRVVSGDELVVESIDVSEPALGGS